MLSFSVLVCVLICKFNSFDEKHSDLRQTVLENVRRHDGILQIHAFYADEEKKKMRFDLVLDYELENRHERFKEIETDLKKLMPDWDIEIVPDIDV